MTTATGNSIIGISTSSFNSTEVINKEYVDRVVTLPPLEGNSGTFLYSTDGVSLSWQPLSTSFEYRNAGQYTFSVPLNANIFFIEAVGAGGGGESGTINGNSGAGGGAGSYASWYIPKSVITSDLTIFVGLGGAGGTTSGQTGSAGAGTTITWTGTNGTYTIVSAAGTTGIGGTSQQSFSSHFQTIFGSDGGTASAGTGISGNPELYTFQSTGAGSGGKIAAAGVGGTIYAYNVAYAATAGNASGSNGGDGIAFEGLPLGGGAGGGGASAGAVGNGGNGIRGSGGGGGGSNTTSFGNGGNGGDGYVRVRWW